MKSICCSTTAIETNINQGKKVGVQTITDTQRSIGAQWVMLKHYWIQSPPISLKLNIAFYENKKKKRRHDEEKF